MILVWLLEANYTLNILVFLYWWKIILGTFLFLHWRPGCRHIGDIATLCSLNIPNNSLCNVSYHMCRKITSHWQPLFSKKMAAVASFSYKIGGGGLIFLQNWRPHFPTKIGSGGLIFLQNWRRRQGFGNITGDCSDMVWILGNLILILEISHQPVGYHLPTSWWEVPHYLTWLLMWSNLSTHIIKSIVQ